MDVVAEHLADLRLRGLAEATTIYARQRALTRLAAWLTEYYAHLPGAPHGNASLLDATAGDLLEWRRALTVSPRSTGPYVDHVRGFYTWLQATGRATGNPAAGIPVPRAHRSLPRPIAETDLLAALDLAPRRVRPWLVLGGWAGLRAKEIALLRRENVAATAAQPFILVAADATKGDRERVVPMSGFVAAELAAYGIPARGWVFRRGDGQPGPNKPWLVSKLANDALHRSGTDATLHQLRHRFLSLLYQQTLDLRLVQELAGHSSPATTAVYTLVSPDKAAPAVEALPAPGRLRVVGG